MDMPDELVLYTRIPNDFYSSVKHIKPLLCDNDSTSMADEMGLERRMYYREIDDMMDCVELLNNELGDEDMCGKTESQIEGLLVDPPWEFIIEDGRNDGSCKWDAKQVVSDIEERKSTGTDVHTFFETCRVNYWTRYWNICLQDSSLFGPTSSFKDMSSR